MEELDDDFGDLYTDVEVQVSAAINATPSFNHLYIGQESKNERGKPKEVLRSDSSLKKVDSIGEELILYGDEDGANPENGKPILNNLKTSVVEAEDEKGLILDNGSDSEDDLHIVLNEDNCQPYPIPLGLNMGSGVMMEGSDDEDEDDDLVIVTEADRPSKDRKWVDSLQLPSDGMEQSSVGPAAERGNGIKGSYISQYSQYKYIRPHAAAFPNNTKINGSGVAVSFSSPLLNRGDWDVSGCNQQIGSSSGPIASSCSAAIPVVAQSGGDFSLPRYRTILDVSIETFERKPWRHPGVDITDFFNFGLDEESWKHYCNCLEQFRHQATMLKKIPVYESRPNQVYEAEFDHETVAPEAVAEENAQIGKGESVSPFLKNADRGMRWLEKPKGRLIQVEGGIGERRPSMDVRRPRNRDSDVVIQIAVQDSTEDSSGSGKEEPRHMDNPIMEVFENGDSSMDGNRGAHSAEFMDKYSRTLDASSVEDGGVCPLTRCSQSKAASNALFLDSDSQGNEHIPDIDAFHHQKAKEHVSEDAPEAMETISVTKEGMDKNSSKDDLCMLKAESSLGDQSQRSSSPSYLDSRSEVSKAGVNIDMERTHKLAKRSSSNSVIRLRESITPDYCHSKESGSNESKTEQGDYKDDSKSENVTQEGQKCCSRMKLRSVAELKIHVDEDEASPTSDRKGWYRGNHLTKTHGTQRERHRDYDFCDGEDLSYYRETEVSIGYRSGRFAKKQVRNAYTETFHKKGHSNFRDEMDPHLRRPWDEREDFFEKRNTAKDNEVKERERYRCERGHANDGTSSFTHDETTWSTSERSSFYTDKERFRWCRRKRDYEHQFRKRAEDDDFVPEHRYREEFVQEKYGRAVPYNSRETEYFHEKSERHVPYIGREIRSPERRERYDDSPSLDLDNSWRSMGYDDDWRHPDHKYSCSYSHRESHIANGRGWRDTASPRNDLYVSRNSDERYVDHWRQIHSEKRRESVWFDPKSKDYRDANRTVYPDDHICNERSYGWESKTLHWTEDELSSRHRNRGRLYSEEASFSYERASRHEPIHVKHASAHGEMLLDERRLERDRNRMIRVENRNSQVSNRISSSFDITDRGNHEEAALRCRDSVDLHLVGWEGKSSGRCSEAGDAKCNDRHGNTIVKEQMTFKHSDESYTGKAVPPHIQRVESNCYRTISSKVEKVDVSDLEHGTEESNEKWLDKFPVTQHHEASALEEGQLAIEEPEKKEVGLPERKWAAEKITPIGDKEEKFRSEDAINKNKAVSGYDDHRILETLAKMEKRRERFKEPIALKEPDKNPKPLPDPVVETAEVKQQRPARKRRWGGS